MEREGVGHDTREEGEKKQRKSGAETGFGEIAFVSWYVICRELELERNSGMERIERRHEEREKGQPPTDTSR